MANVVVIGPEPPPVDGRAQATSWLISALRADHHQLRVFNTHTSALAKARRCLAAALSLMLGPRVDDVIVVASGGSGLLFESLPLFAARMRRLPTVMTHHSARYIRERARVFGWALAAAGPRLRHAVLDEAMGGELCAVWGIDAERVVIVDNAGLMPLAQSFPEGGTRVGAVHLSNLSTAKGLDAVLEVAAMTKLSVRLIGTVSSEASATLSRARERGIDFDAVGPRFDSEKMHELTQARCFLFLSSYEHEAQPLVLYEAVSVGCVPLVWRAGWVGEQMERLGLRDNVFEVGDVSGVAAKLQSIVSMDDASFAALADEVRVAFSEHQIRSADQYRSMLAHS